MMSGTLTGRSRWHSVLLALCLVALVAADAGGQSASHPRQGDAAGVWLQRPAVGQTCGPATAGQRPNTWRLTGSLTTARELDTATVLRDGRVLVTGGDVTTGSGANQQDHALASAELYDPQTGCWSVTGSLAVARFAHTATLLDDGRVLVAGGTGDDPNRALTSAEIYDPATGRWSVTGSMAVGRDEHTATLLDDGRVLVAGGTGDGLASAELYDPRTGRWTLTGSMSVARTDHTATLLRTGEVLVVGGNDVSASATVCELYDPRTGQWTQTGSLLVGRVRWHTATLLADGRVLVAGGDDASREAEIYDPRTGEWSGTGSMAVGRSEHTATLLPDGRVLVAGGDDGGSDVADAEVYTPSLGMWAGTGSMPIAPFRPTAVLLSTGQVLVEGGAGTRAALYTPGTGPLVGFEPDRLAFALQQVGTASAPQTVTLTNTAAVPAVIAGVSISGTDPADFVAMACPGGRIRPAAACTIDVRFTPRAVGSRSAMLVIADDTPTSPHLIALSGTGFASGPGTWARAGSLVDAESDYHGAGFLLSDGRVLALFFGTNSQPQVYDSRTRRWAPVGGNSVVGLAPDGASLTRLPNGTILVAGGFMDSANCEAVLKGVTPDLTGDAPDPVCPLSLKAATLFDPYTGTARSTGHLAIASGDDTATLLPTGEVLVAGGATASCYQDGCDSTPLAGAQLYDPHVGTWRKTRPLPARVVDSLATLLPDGRILLVGRGARHPEAMLYDPATARWVMTAAPSALSAGGTLTRLRDGTVLLVPGGTAATELYDPRSGSWRATGAMQAARSFHSATLLRSGQVLVAGGTEGRHDTILSSAELYNPRTKSWTLTGSMIAPHSGHIAVLLRSGQVLVTGGDSVGQTGQSTTTEIYTGWRFSSQAGSPPDSTG